MNNLIWKQVVGYENLYMVSDCGDIKILSKRIGGENGYIAKEKMGTIRKDKNGYPIFNFSKDDKKKTIKIHRVVALAFIENPCNKPQVNHINGIKSDNRVSNLEWCTGSENMVHSFRVLNRKKPKWSTGLCGKLSKRSKAVIQYDLDGNKIKEWESMNLAQNSTGFFVASISRCCRGESSDAYGFKWSYV